MRLTEPRVISRDGTIDPKRLNDVLRDATAQVNNLSEGQVSATSNAQTAVPTTGTYRPGDYVKNSAPAELGTTASKYVILGWVCVAAPTTFVQCRSLTGN